MKHEVFAIYDEKALVYWTPFFAVNAGVATRMFTDLSNDPKTMPSRYPTDFSLYHVGSFSDDTALLVSLAQPVLLGKALAYKSSPEVK